MQLIDGPADAVRVYLDHFWTHWSGPNFKVETSDFDALVDRYARPGAFQAATNWCRVGAGYAANALNERPPAQAKRFSTPTHVLWQELDPLFPRSWVDRLEEFFSDITVHTLMVMATSPRWRPPAGSPTPSPQR